jgi:hypothetical protein
MIFLRSQSIQEGIPQMRTVKSLVEELSRFPNEALCHAYEGEVTGIVVRYGGGEGVIHCSAHEEAEPDTELLQNM